MIHTELLDFIQNRMRMSHVYQPVLLMALLRNGGELHQREIAKALLTHDESQIDYYTNIVNNMVGKVLRGHQIIERDKETKRYSLVHFGQLTPQERDTLISACEDRLTEFKSARGESVFDHRRKSSGYVSGTIRYEVLKRARFRCELCGISAEEKALEVDHIVPRSKGGSDDISNFQSLCYSCNAMKRDRDDTDFRHIIDSYQYREAGCIFCEVDSDRIIVENELAYVIRDGYPVTALHSLVIPKRHVTEYFDLGQAEINAIHRLIIETKENIQAADGLVTGFNIGVNAGESAGQTVFHCHIHLIPRRDGDVSNPRGGVRHLIPGKGSY